MLNDYVNYESKDDESYEDYIEEYIKEREMEKGYEFMCLNSIKY